MPQKQEYIVTWDGDYYTIVTLNDCASDPSNVLTVIVSGVAEKENNTGIMIFPNPFSQELVMEQKTGSNPVRFEIISTTGQIVHQGILIEKKIINTSGLTGGPYIIRLFGTSVIEYRKLIKE